MPFDEGSLTGTLTADTTWPKGDWRNLYFTPAALAETLPRVEALKALVPPGSSLPDLALRFILHHPAVSTTIPGMRSLGHVDVEHRRQRRAAARRRPDRGPARPSLGAHVAGAVMEHAPDVPHPAASFLDRHRRRGRRHRPARPPALRDGAR